MIQIQTKSTHPLPQIQTRQKRRGAAPQAIKPDSKPHRAAYRNADTHSANKHPASPEPTAGNRSPIDKPTAKTHKQTGCDNTGKPENSP